MIYTINTSDAYKCLIFAEYKLRLHPSTMQLTHGNESKARATSPTCCAQVHAFRYAMQRGERTRHIYSSGSAYSRATLPPPLSGQIWSLASFLAPFVFLFSPLHLTTDFLLFSRQDASVPVRS